MTDRVPRAPILVIGYGNDLRSDDGVGRWVADEIAALDLDGVEVRSVVQLTPELALDVADRELVVFVDASVATDRVRSEEVEPASGPSVTTHHGDPSGLVAGSVLVGDPPRRSLLVTIPAERLEMGAVFSERAASGARDALERIVRLAAASSPA